MPLWCLLFFLLWESISRFILYLRLSSCHYLATIQRKDSYVSQCYQWIWCTAFNPFWEDEIAPKLLDGKNVIIAAHGNSLRALSKYIERISDDDIMNLEMATGEPVVYDFDDKLNMTNKTKLGK